MWCLSGWELDNVCSVCRDFPETYLVYQVATVPQELYRSNLFDGVNSIFAM